MNTINSSHLAHITLITGGQRSGKSSFAQKRALELSEKPVYIATSRIWDKEHAARIERHKQDRLENWQNIESEKYIGDIDLNGKVAVLDCVTLWITNFFFDNENNIERSLEQAKMEIQKLMQQNATIFIVTNEIGMGAIAMNEVQRKFTDLQGWINQHLANVADEVILMVSGIPLQVK